MSSLFGVPMGTLMMVFLVAFIAVMGVVAFLALRNPVLLKMGMRNIPRRRGRTVIIVLGLMLGTIIIAAALSTGDTMTHTIRSSTIASLGEVDELISLEGTDTETSIFVESATDIEYFNEGLFDLVADVAGDIEVVDGIAPVISEPVSLQDPTSQQNEPRAMLFAIDPARMAGLGEIRQVGGSGVSLADLAPGEAFLNAEAADELNAAAGNQVLLFAGDEPAPLLVRAVVEYEGALTEDSAIFLPLDEAQRLLQREGEIKHIVISNAGGALSGVVHTDEVIAALEPTLTPLNLEADPTKENALDFADDLGSIFTSFFVTFGTFSIVAGVLLIFLIFVMLAAERKSEMGMARAVGIKRRHLIQMFLFEGVVYDLVAAAVGAMLGLAIAYGMVLIMARAFATFGVEIEHDFRLRSLIVAYTLGMLLTFIVVTVSAWRVSVLNIVTAIRNLPDPVLPGGAGWRRGWLWGALGVLLAHFYLPMTILALWLSGLRLRGLAKRVRGLRPPLIWFVGVLGVELALALTLVGLTSEEATPFFLGTSLLIVGLVPLLRRLRLPDRVAYTVPGIALVVWWLLPFDTFDFILPDFSEDISIFIVSGIMVILGATWTVMYNSDLLLHGIMAGLGRIRVLAPVLKTAIAYPLTNRFRTGMTVAMFSLVVFTLVVMATLTNAFSRLFNDEEAFGGGFDIRATTTRVNPIGDAGAAIEGAPGLNGEDFEVVADQSFFTLQAKQAGVQGRQFETYPVRGLDDQFLASNTYEFAIRAEGYESEQEVWQALADNPGLAVVDPIPVPRRDDFGFQAGAPEFKLEGFFLEDTSFAPVEIEMRDPQTDTAFRLTIIAVLKDTFPEFMVGISTSQRKLEATFVDRAEPTVHFLRLAEGADAEATADALEATFLANGMEAEVLADELKEAVGTQLTFNYILQGFMGLGLVVGVAALGVISARSVVERRQQIGVLRAIGFRRGMVQLSFLLESSFVALLGIVVGCVLGLILSFNIIRDSSQQGSAENIEFAVPWLNLTIIFLIAYAASLLTTFLPARQASRVYPAEALRYE